MDTEKEVKKVLRELKTGKGSSLYGALIMLRTTLIKSSKALQQLMNGDYIKLLLLVLDDRRRHSDKVKTVDILMSILANVCIDEKARDQVSLFLTFT